MRTGRILPPPGMPVKSLWYSAPLPGATGVPIPDGPRHARHLARRDRGVAAPRGTRTGDLRPLRLPRDPDSDLRDDRSLLAGSRLLDRYRPQGDVHLRLGRRFRDPP